MRIIKPLGKIVKQPEEKLLFLAGSIEMGQAEEWQEKIQAALAHTKWVILNPRRDHWDSSWVQQIENDQFRQQVEWEMGGLDVADTILMYFSPNTKSPITLLELGLQASRGGNQRLIVCCPDGFWRQGNVQIVCARYKLPFVKNLEEAISLLPPCV